MKCMSCGNLIPDASTVCPYCNSNVGPVVAETPVTPEVSVQTTPVAPVAPEMVAPAAPVTPEVMAPVTPVAPVAPAPVAEPVVAQPTPEVAPVQMAAPVVPETPATPVLPQDQGMVSAPVTPEVAVPVQQPVEMAPVQPEIVPTPAPTTTMVANGITPEGGFTGGEKIASTAEAKKSSKGKLIAILIVAVILIAGIVAGVLYYNSQYKSAGKRIDSIVNGMFKDLANIKNEDVELASGTYSFEGSINANENNISAKLNGKYAFDIANQVADYTLNVESINMGQELLDSGALNLELYAEKHKVYFLLQNFYEKYIYVDTEGMTEVTTDTEEELELDVNTMVIAIREATKAGLKAAPNTQTVGEVTIGGTKQKANIVEIELNEANAKKILKGFVNSLANNDKFLDEIARVSGEEKAEIKEGLLSVLEEDTDSDEEEYEDYLPKSTTTGSISFYTAMFGEEFLGSTIKMNQVYDKKDENYVAEYYEDSKMVLNVYPKGNALKVDMTMNDKKLFEMSLEETYEKNSTEEKTETDFSITLHAEESGAVTIKFKTTVTSDLQPKVDKVNTKDSIAFENLTETDITNIYDKVKNYGTFGMLIDSILSSYMEQPSYSNPYGDSMCAMAFGCVDNGDGTSECQYCADEDCYTTGTVTCTNDTGYNYDYDYDLDYNSSL